MANPSFSCVLLFVAALVLLSAASTGHAQQNVETTVIIDGQVPCLPIPGNAVAQSSSGGAAGVNVTVSCGLGQSSTDVAAAVTDVNGAFNINTNVSAPGIILDFVTAQCVAKVNLTTANPSSCSWPRQGQLVAKVKVLILLGNLLRAVTGPFILVP